MPEKDTILILDDNCSDHEVIEEVYNRYLKNSGLRVLFPRFTDPAGNDFFECDSFYRNEQRLSATVEMLTENRNRIGLLVLDTSMPDIDLKNDFGSLKLERLPLWLWSIMDYNPQQQLDIAQRFEEKGFNRFENFITRNEMYKEGLPMIRERFKKI